MQIQRAALNTVSLEQPKNLGWKTNLEMMYKQLFKYVTQFSRKKHTTAQSFLYHIIISKLSNQKLEEEAAYHFEGQPLQLQLLNAGELLRSDIAYPWQNAGSNCLQPTH